MKHTPETIIQVLHSITEVKLNSDGEVDAWFDGEADASGKREFEYGSFTRELLELIEEHLSNGQSET